MNNHEKSRVEVLHLSGIAIGGIETLILDINSELKDKDISFEILSPKPGRKSFYDQFLKNGTIVHFIQKNNNISYTMSLIKHLIKNNKYKVVHSHNLFSSG